MVPVNQVITQSAARSAGTAWAALARLALLTAAASLAACASIPTSGPSTHDIRAAAAGIRIVDVDESVVERLIARRTDRLFSEVFPGKPTHDQIVGPGDVLEVSVWEAPPTVLFSSGGGASLLSSTVSGSSSYALPGAGTTASVTTLPQQMVGFEGSIYVPFAGTVDVAGKSLMQIEADITRRLEGKANKPQVLVRLIGNYTAYVTIVGEVATSTRMPLTPRGEHLLDALAAAGGTRDPIEKVTLQVTRGSSVHSLPLAAVISDPRQNIALQPGDVVTALYQSLSFTALGATGKNDEVKFEATGISLAQGLARAGSLLDSRSDAQGVFIFRLESQDNTSEPDGKPATSTARAPVLYRFDLKDPRAFFLAQNFAMENKDVLYVANAPAAQLQKFLNLLVSTIYPIQGAVTATK